MSKESNSTAHSTKKNTIFKLSGKKKNEENLFKHINKIRPNAKLDNSGFICTCKTSEYLCMTTLILSSQSFSCIDELKFKLKHQTLSIEHSPIALCDDDVRRTLKKRE